MSANRISDSYATEPVRDEPTKLFDITCVVGSVYAGGDKDPRVVAFTLIGQANHDGEFSFPTEDEGIVNVSVYTTDAPEQATPAPRTAVRA